MKDLTMAILVLLLCIGSLSKALAVEFNMGKTDPIIDTSKDPEESCGYYLRVKTKDFPDIDTKMHKLIRAITYKEISKSKGNTDIESQNESNKMCIKDIVEYFTKIDTEVGHSEIGQTLVNNLFYELRNDQIEKQFVVQAMIMIEGNYIMLLFESLLHVYVEDFKNNINDPENVQKEKLRNVFELRNVISETILKFATNEKTHKRFKALNLVGLIEKYKTKMNEMYETKTDISEFSDIIEETNGNINKTLSALITED